MAKKEKRQRRRMRLLPITVTMLGLLFIIKVNDVYLGSERLREIYGVRDALAAEAKKEEEKKPEEKKEGDHAAADKKEDTGHGDEKKDAKEGDHGDAKKEEAGHGEKKDEAKKEDGGHGEEKKEEGGHGEAKKEEEGGHGGGKKEEPEPRTFGTGKSTVKDIEARKAKEAQPRFTKNELDLLQNLSKRREELDAREKELDLKSKVLDATDKRINDKIAEMKILEAELTKVLAQYNEKQNMQIKSLVKIYENMKPEEAAAIFNELEMPILLEVIGKMSERKVALVLANMSPKRARDVTQELAEKRKKATDAAAATPAKP